MVRLHLVVEGQTEETFVRRILAPHLAGFNVVADVRCVETGRDRRKNRIYRGGLSNYEKLKNDLRCWILQDSKPDVYFTTMVDLYALPANFPDYGVAGKEGDVRKKTTLLEAAFKSDIESCVGGRVHFVPYIQLHEFETLLLSKPEAIIRAVGNEKQLAQLRRDIQGYNDIEMINGGQESAPSKRIIKHIPEYEDQKASAGPIIADHIGLEHMRSACQHFNQWLMRMESLDG